MRTSRPRLLDDAGDAADQPAAADRDDHRREVRRRPRAARGRASPGRRSTCGSSNGCTNVAPVCAGAVAREGDALVDGVAAEVDDAAEAADRGDLGHGRAGGHEDLARDAAGAGGVGDGLRVVAGAAGDDAGALGRGAELGERAAELERAGPLEVLGLDEDRAPARSPRLRLVRTGVWRTRSAIRSRAACTASIPSQPPCCTAALSTHRDISGIRRPGNRRRGEADASRSAPPLMIGAPAMAASSSPAPEPASLIADHAYHELRQRIVTLQLRPGTALREDELMAELGIGRTPLREAVKRLVARVARGHPAAPRHVRLRRRRGRHRAHHRGARGARGLRGRARRAADAARRRASARRRCCARSRSSAGSTTRTR